MMGGWLRCGRGGGGYDGGVNRDKGQLSQTPLQRANCGQNWQ